MNFSYSLLYFSIFRCLQNLKPYHGILLLEDILTLLNSLPPDASPSLTRFLKVYSPLKNFQMISADSDLTIAQVIFTIILVKESLADLFLLNF